MHHTMPEIRVAPRLLEIDALFPLDGEICSMSFLERFRGHPVHTVMDIHELRHVALRSNFPGGAQPTSAPTPLGSVDT